MVAKALNNVGLPRQSPVTQVGGIQRRFLVNVRGVILAEVVEYFRGRVRRYTLGREILVLALVRRQQGSHLLRGVGAHASRRSHHQTCLLDHIFAGVFLQEIVRNVTGDGNAHPEYEDQKNIELYQQSHGGIPFFLTVRFQPTGIQKIVGSNALEENVDPSIITLPCFSASWLAAWWGILLGGIDYGLGAIDNWA